MRKNFNELDRIEGVSESLLFNKWGDLIIPQLKYRDKRIINLGKEIAYCAAFLEKIHHEVDFIEIVYEDRRILVRMSNNFFIMVICLDHGDIPMIKLTMNVLHEEVKSEKEIQKIIQKSQGKIDLLTEAQKEAGWKELLNRISLIG